MRLAFGEHSRGFDGSWQGDEDTLPTPLLLLLQANSSQTTGHTQHCLHPNCKRIYLQHSGRIEKTKKKLAEKHKLVVHEHAHSEERVLLEVNKIAVNLP